MIRNLFVKLIMENPGITSADISQKLNLNINTVRKHLKETTERYPAFHTPNNGSREMYIFLLERQKKFCEPYKYVYKKMTSLHLNYP